MEEIYVNKQIKNNKKKKMLRPFSFFFGIKKKKEKGVLTFGFSFEFK